MKHTHYFFLLFLLIFISCKRSETSNAKEIYFNDLAPAYTAGIENGDTVLYKTEILMLFSDSNGVLLNDKRDVAAIKDILADKMKLVADYPKIDFKKAGITRIEKVPVDESNFFIRILNPNDFNMIYKCHFIPETKKLKLVQFLVQGSDTLFLTKPAGDSLGVYYYYAAQTIPGLEYPKHETKRDITAPEEVEAEGGVIIQPN
jgi:hypothetical protein